MNRGKAGVFMVSGNAVVFRARMREDHRWGWARLGYGWPLVVLAVAMLVLAVFDVRAGAERLGVWIAGPVGHMLAWTALGLLVAVVAAS